MGRTYKSGSLKRKERKVKDNREKKDQKYLFNFGFSRVDTDNNNEHLDKTQITRPDEDTNTREKVLVDDACVILSPQQVDKGRVESDSDASNSENEDDLSKTSDVEKSAASIGNGCLKAGFDVGSLQCDCPTSQQIKEAVDYGPPEHPLVFPVDSVNAAFPITLLQITLNNNERVQRDWLIWSTSKRALFCFPCRLFSTQHTSVRSHFSSSGYPCTKKWKKLYDKIPKHEQSSCHKECYMKWKILQKQIQGGCTIFNEIQQQIQTEAEIWKKILQRLLHVTLFLGERGLAFRGHSREIGDPKNGNFLGILELLSLYDPLLCNYMNKVKHSQISKKRLQVHYLSDEIQNEFIHCIAEKVRSVVLKERETAKYFSIIVDATPDSAHIEQTTFILRYLRNQDGIWGVQERFLEFADCNKKTGQEIANLIRSTLEEKFAIPISDCRGQGYDNGSNMSGIYRGVQAHLLSWNSTAKFSPCACHSLNLCGVQAAESCVEAMTFFGIVQQLYNLFSRSPQRWEVLKKNIGCSFHGLSQTRWSARVDSVRPIVKHLNQLLNALDEVKELNLTSETHAVLLGLKKYLSSFECLLMASIWIKILVPIDQRNKILQARNATIDIEVINLQNLIEDLDELRNKWNGIISEVKTVASAMKIDTEFKEETMRTRKRKQISQEITEEDAIISPEEKFKINVFFYIIDVVRANISFRFEAIKALEKSFGFLWKYMEMSIDDLEKNCKIFVEEYKADVTMDLYEEVKHLKAIHLANISETTLKPLDLINKLSEINCENLFPNLIIALRMFFTLPVTVAEAERSFSAMSRIKNCLRSTMGQERLSDLGVLAIESDLARKVNFDEVIEKFANSKARKALLKS